MPLCLTKRTGRIALALVALMGVSGCESLDKFNPFGDNKKPLPGARSPVFPEGVPGVDYSAKYSQPSNANAPLDALQTQNQGQGGQGGQSGQQPARQ